MDDESVDLEARLPNVFIPGMDTPASDLKTPSTCLLRFRGSAPATIWSLSDTLMIPGVEPRTKLCLQLDQVAVVGRQEGGHLEYLDPAFRPTSVEPTTGSPVLCGGEYDICVSRGHFMLRGTTEGVLFVNGVPRSGGGIRPPLNGTRLLEPVRRELLPAEEYTIARGCSATFGLPNGTEISISSE